MEEEAKKEENDAFEETDHFRLFMFGTNYSSKGKQIKTPEEDMNSRLLNNNSRKHHRGDAWILGINSDHSKQEEKSADEQPKDEHSFDAIANFLDQIDLELLMKSVDSFMTSANELKPIIKKITPFIKKWID